MTDRLTNTTVSVPFIYGSVAVWLGSDAQETATHRWTLYVRGPSNEDLSPMLSKVVFTLHPSFDQSIREIFQPPYEISEYGWGEFQAGIRLHFKDPNETPIELLQHLKLYPPEGQTLNIKHPIINEHYDEIVFTNPTKEFFSLLSSIPATFLPYIKKKKRKLNEQNNNNNNNNENKNDNNIIKNNQFESELYDLYENNLFPIYSDADNVKVLSEAREFITGEIQKTKELIQKVEAEATHLKLLLATRKK